MIWITPWGYLTINSIMKYLLIHFILQFMPIAKFVCYMIIETGCLRIWSFGAANTQWNIVYLLFTIILTANLLQIFHEVSLFVEIRSNYDFLIKFLVYCLLFEHGLFPTLYQDPVCTVFFEFIEDYFRDQIHSQEVQKVLFKTKTVTEKSNPRTTNSASPVELNDDKKWGRRPEIYSN